MLKFQCEMSCCLIQLQHHVIEIPSRYFADCTEVISAASILLSVAGTGSDYEARRGEIKSAALTHRDLQSR